MWFPILSLTLATLASGHGIIASPTARSAVSAMKAVCSQQVTNNLQSNEYGDIQQLSQIGASQGDFDASLCDVSLCKGIQFDDNTANVQKFTPGQVVPITVDIQAKHTGTANVSVVDTATNKMIRTNSFTFPCMQAPLQTSLRTRPVSALRCRMSVHSVGQRALV